jgi:hypothetical protein
MKQTIENDIERLNKRDKQFGKSLKLLKWGSLTAVALFIVYLIITSAENFLGGLVVFAIVIAVLCIPATISGIRYVDFENKIR